MNDDVKTNPATGSNTGIPITRSNSFAQFYADAFLPLPLVDGIDIAALAATPQIDGQSLLTVLEDGIERLSIANINPEPAFTEVLRLRLDTDGFRNLLTVLIGAAVQTGFMGDEEMVDLVQSAVSSAEREGPVRND